MAGREGVGVGQEDKGCRLVQCRRSPGRERKPGAWKPRQYPPQRVWVRTALPVPMSRESGCGGPMPHFSLEALGHVPFTLLRVLRRTFGPFSGASEPLGWEGKYDRLLRSSSWSAIYSPSAIQESCSVAVLSTRV